MTAYIVNPLCLFLLVWGTATILYLGGVLAGTFPFPKPLAVGALLLNIGTFCLGYLTWSLFQSLPPAPPDLEPGLGAAPRLTRERLARALKLTLLVGLGLLLMELYRFAALASRFNTSWSYLLTHPSTLRLRIVMFIGSNVFQTSGMVMLLSLTSSIFSLGFVLLGVFLHFDRSRWKYVYLSAFLALSLLISLIHLSRYEMTANVLFLVFAYCFVSAQDRGRRPVPEGGSWNVTGPPSRSRRRTSGLRLALPLVAVALLFLLIDLFLRKSVEFSDASRLKGFLFHLYWYIASPLAALNDFLAAHTGHFTLGQNMFFPLYKWLCRFDLAQPTEFSVYGEKVYIPYVANTYTYLRALYEDFGILGVAVVPYGLGWIMAALRQRTRHSLPILNLYVVLLTFILFSFYNYFLTSNQIYMQILFGFLFLRYDLRAPVPERGAPAPCSAGPSLAFPHISRV